MKAQLRLAGDRRKLGRNGFSSDIPREYVDPPENLRDLRDHLDLLQSPTALSELYQSVSQRMLSLLVTSTVAFNLGRPSPLHVASRHLRASAVIMGRKPGVSSPEELSAFVEAAGAKLVVVDVCATAFKHARICARLEPDVSGRRPTEGCTFKSHHFLGAQPRL